MSLPALGRRHTCEEPFFGDVAISSFKEIATWRLGATRNDIMI